MNGDMEHGAQKKAPQLVYCIVFFVLLCLPVGATLLFSPQSLQVMPTSDGNLFQSADAMLKANTEALWTKPYAMRTVAAVDYTLFKKIISEQAFAGKEGNLFFKGDQAVDNLLGQYVVPAETLDSICQAQQQTHDALAERGVKYLIAVIPGKEYVYTDALLPQYTVRDGAVSNRKSQILQALRDRTDVEVLDLTDALRDETTQRPTYMRTDSHWNYNGAYRASVEIVQHLQKDFPQLEAPDRSAYAIFPTNPSIGMNLASLSYLDTLLIERDIPTYKQDNPTWVSMASEASYADPGKPDIVGDQFSMVVRENPAQEGQPNLMLIGDSFAGWSDLWGVDLFFSDTFHRYAAYHFLNTQVDMRLVDAEQSDVVVLLYLESNLEMLSRPPVGHSKPYTLGDTVSFTAQGDFTGVPYFFEGLGTLEENFVWTDGPQASAGFMLSTPVSGNLLLDIDLNMVYPSETITQAVVLYVNDIYIDTRAVQNGDARLSFEIPADALTRESVWITLKFPNATQEPGGGRLLALAMESLTLSEAP